MSIQITENELYRCFGLFNGHFFDAKLPEPAITIQTKGKRQAYGWCSTAERWQSKDESIKKYEINLTAEHLDRDPVDIMRTLLHEMIHLYNVVNGVKDCSRGGTFHNKRFKEAAERFGMHFDDSPDPKYGWTLAKLTPATIDLIQSWNINREAFQIARLVPSVETATAKKKSNSYKLECPKCGIKLRASKPGIVVLCKECEVELVEN
jgi:hypothetical protein